MEKITAVVVTYNRKELLMKTINALRNQTRALESIIVVNNGSTDGTDIWLDSQDDLTVFHQVNCGGSGGFYRGIKEAYDAGFDRIWCMDDDVFPHPTCLADMLDVSGENIGILCPERYMNGNVFLSEFKKLNLSNPFKSLYGPPVTINETHKGFPIEIESMSFEGPLICREVVEKIGLPNKDLFIIFDDTEYSYRAVKAGFKVLYIPNAKMDKHYFAQNKTKEEQIIANKWKYWYGLRNNAYFCHHYGTNFIFKNFGEYRYLLKMLLTMLFNLPRNHKYEWTDVIKLFVIDRMGRKEKLGLFQ